MRSIALAMIVLFGAVAGAAGQANPNISVISGDAAVTYHWVRSNTQPGDCGCFYLNGGGVSGSWNFRPHFAAVAEIASEHTGNGPYANSLTLSSYLAGARYIFPQRFPRHLRPFAQMLVGAEHAGGGIAGAGDGTFAFATRIGGGIDLPVGSHFAIRAIQADYDLTTFQNTTNTHQNNLLLGAGLLYRWSHEK